MCYHVLYAFISGATRSHALPYFFIRYILIYLLKKVDGNALRLVKDAVKLHKKMVAHMVTRMVTRWKRMVTRDNFPFIP